MINEGVSAGAGPGEGDSRAPPSGGAEGNERLTAMTGAVLLTGSLVAGLVIALLTVHLAGKWASFA